MSFQELMENPKATKFFLATTSLILGVAYLFFGPTRTEASTVQTVFGFMEAVALTYIIGEAGLKGIKAVGDSFGKK